MLMPAALAQILSQQTRDILLYQMNNIYIHTKLPMNGSSVNKLMKRYSIKHTTTNVASEYNIMVCSFID